MHSRIRSAKLIAVVVCLSVVSVWGAVAHGVGSQMPADGGTSSARDDILGNHGGEGLRPEAAMAEVVATGIPGAGAVMQAGR